MFRANHLTPGTINVELSFGNWGSAFLGGVDIVAGTVTDLGHLEVGTGGLSGQVTDSDGRPVPGARVLLTAPGFARLGTSGPIQRETSTDETGRYRFRMLAARRWSLREEKGDGSQLQVHSVVAACIDRGSPFFNREYRARLQGQGRIEIVLTPALVALRINKIQGGSDSTTCLFLNGFQIPPRESITLPSGYLEFA